MQKFSAGLFRQFQVELVEQLLLIAGRVGTAGQHEVATVGGRQMDIHHLHGGALLEDGSGRQARRARPGQALQGDVQAVGDEDVGLDPILALVEDRTDGEVVLEGPVAKSGGCVKGLRHQP